MQPDFNLGTYILLFGCFLCVLACILLSFYSFRKNINTRWLTFYYFIAGYALFVSFLLYSHFITVSPWFFTYRTGFIAGFLFMPVSLFYMRSLLQQKVFRRFDLIHFIPVAIFIIDFFPYYLKPASFKLQQAMMAARSLNVGWKQFSEGWLGIGVAYVPLRLAQGTFYWIWEIRMIRQISKIPNKKTFVEENRHILQWARLFCAMQALYFIPYYLNLAFGSKDLFFAMQHVTSSLGVAITIFALLLNPEILYGLKGKWIRDRDLTEGLKLPDRPVFRNAVFRDEMDNILEENKKNPGLLAEDLILARPLLEELDARPRETTNFSEILVPEDTASEGLDKKASYFSFEKMKEVDSIMQAHLSKNKSYLNKRYSAHHLSSEISIQPYLISAVVNQIHQNHFNDYINKFRVAHVKSLIDSGKGKLFTLEALAEQSGFNNRNSFTLAFKKYTQLTPSAYIKKSELIS